MLFTRRYRASRRLMIMSLPQPPASLAAPHCAQLELWRVIASFRACKRACVPARQRATLRWTSRGATERASVCGLHMWSWVLETGALCGLDVLPIQAAPAQDASRMYLGQGGNRFSEIRPSHMKMDLRCKAATWRRDGALVDSELTHCSCPGVQSLQNTGPTASRDAAVHRKRTAIVGALSSV